MPAPRNRRHILVRKPPSSEEYTPHRRKIDPPAIPGPQNRQLHAKALNAALRQAERETKQSRDAVQVSVHGAEPGLYVQFESPPGVELKLESLEDRRSGIELVAVQWPQRPEQLPVQLATVFVPDGKVRYFITRFEQYATEETKKGEPRHKAMVDRISTLRRATLRALWTDAPEVYPGEDEVIWWEVWLRRHDGSELERLLDFAEQAQLSVAERRLAFDDRIVVLVKGSARQLSDSLDVLNDLAEVRRAKESAAFFADSTADHQAEWIDDLIGRMTPPPLDAPAVCLLDTGVTRSHPLLENLIAPQDAMAVDPGWGSHDDGGGPRCMGHGTEMAGLAAYGDLAAAFASSSSVAIRHRIESVKILPPRGSNPPELYGAVTAQGVMRPEINAPHRLRAYSLAVTAADERDRGQPTSWSAAIDALAAGRIFDPSTQGLVYLDEAEESSRRLFVISAGNVAPDRLEIAHLDRSDLEAVHDPGQAWNALTVGGFTDRALINDPAWDGWAPLARPGDLSPWSTTSVTFQDTWPIKPDVVFESGNVGRSGAIFDPVPDLCLLSTYYKPAEKPLALFWATSAATAAVARMAAIVRAEYPELWPETVRALLVHSARWTRAMQAQLRGASRKRARARLVRRYGFGVPNIDRALRSANDALTLVVQGSLRPFSAGKMQEMHLYELPWPKDVLEELGQTFVRLRVTLSYFVEPNPGRRGWKRRHRYASHGLRFGVKTPTESVEDFRKRLNLKALDEDEVRPGAGSDSEGWFLGEQARNKGSIHSDEWAGTAADLAERGAVGIYPVSGWWKDQPKRDRSKLGARYALVVSIETEAADVDIWTPVAQQIGSPVEVQVES
jgi:hypothetical protein